MKPDSRSVALAMLPVLLIACGVEASSGVTVEARRLLVLSDMTGKVESAVVQANHLVVGAGCQGPSELVFFDLNRQSKPHHIHIVTEQAGNPSKPGYGRSRWWIATCQHQWLILDDELHLLRALNICSGAGAKYPPIVLGDRAIVYGWVGLDGTGTEDAYLFELTEQGDCVPILEYSSAADPERRGLEFQWDGTLAGGLGTSPDGGFAFTDPRSYRIFVFDGDAGLTRVIQGSNPRWHPPNWSAADPATPATEGEWWRWAFQQITPKAPVFLDADHLAVLVGYPTPGRIGQSIELDVYRIDGKVVATGVPVAEIVGVGQLNIALRSDPKPGDDIVVVFNPDLPYPLAKTRRPPEVWSITVKIGETEVSGKLPAGHGVE